MTPEQRYRADYRRQKYLPGQIEATRRKLAMLEREAARYGMHDLVMPEHRA